MLKQRLLLSVERAMAQIERGFPAQVHISVCRAVLAAAGERQRTSQEDRIAATLLGLIHGLIAQAQQVFFSLTMVRIQGHTDA